MEALKACWGVVVVDGDGINGGAGVEVVGVILGPTSLLFNSTRVAVVAWAATLLVILLTEGFAGTVMFAVELAVDVKLWTLLLAVATASPSFLFTPTLPAATFSFDFFNCSILSLVFFKFS